MPSASVGQHSAQRGQLVDRSDAGPADIVDQAFDGLQTGKAERTTNGVKSLFAWPPSWRGIAHVAAIVVGVGVAFHASLALMYAQIAAGGALTYLAAVPVWTLTIAHRRLNYRRQVDVHDRQTDWIVAVPVALVASLAAAEAQSRIGDVALLWRPDLLALIVWCWACTTVIFGLRRTAAPWPAWVFAACCMPAVCLGASAALGGGIRGSLIVDLLLACLATATAAERGRRRLSTAAALGIGLPLTLLGSLAGLGAIVAVSAFLPAIALAAISRWRRIDRPGLTGRHAGIDSTRARTLLADIGALAVVALLVGVVIKAPETTANARTLPAFEGAPKLAAGWTLHAHQSFAWASSYFGNSAKLVRYSYSGPKGRRIDVDILGGVATADLSVLPMTVFYGDYISRDVRMVRLPDGIRAHLTISDPASDLTPLGSAWLELSWTTRSQSGLAQSIAVFVSQYVGAQLPAIDRPGLRLLVLHPLNELVRGNVGGTSSVNDIAMSIAVSVSRDLLPRRA